VNVERAATRRVAVAALVSVGALASFVLAPRARDGVFLVWSGVVSSPSVSTDVVATIEDRRTEAQDRGCCDGHHAMPGWISTAKLGPFVLRHRTPPTCSYGILGNSDDEIEASPHAPTVRLPREDVRCAELRDVELRSSDGVWDVQYFDEGADRRAVRFRVERMRTTAQDAATVLATSAFVVAIVALARARGGIARERRNAPYRDAPPVDDPAARKRAWRVVRTIVVSLGLAVLAAILRIKSP
jgi:hypothetical protein